jgi:hypothetical protein
MKKKDKMQKVELSQKSVEAIAKAVAKEVAKTLIVYAPLPAKNEPVPRTTVIGKDTAPLSMKKEKDDNHLVSR